MQCVDPFELTLYGADWLLRFGWLGLAMDMTQRFAARSALGLLLTSVMASLAFGQSAAPDGRGSAGKATVVIAVDLREQTSLRDVPQVGDVLFRRIDRYQSRANDDYDLAIKGSVASDWKSVFGRPDDNRAPQLFAIEPGTYVIEKINIGSGPTTIGPGIDAGSHAPRFGTFTVRPGEVLNLGRLVVHMHWHEGYFDAKVEDNTADARHGLAESSPQLAARLQTRLITVVPKLPFRAGGGRL
jgi:hypothetical protein